MSESDGCNGHGDDGQNLEDEIQRRCFLAKDGKHRDIRENVNSSQSNRPRGVVAVTFVLVDKDECATNGNEVEDRARKRAQEKEVDHKQHRTEQLECQDARLPLLLIGKNAEEHTKYANDLCNNFNRFHIGRLRQDFRSAFKHLALSPQHYTTYFDGCQEE